MNGKDVFEIYGDESSTDKGQLNTIYGAVCLHESKAKSLSAKIDDWKRTLPDAPSEFHWTALSAAREGVYQDFCRGTRAHMLHPDKHDAVIFRSMVVPNWGHPYERESRDDHELGIYKLWHTFILNAFHRWIPDGSHVRIILDERQTQYSLATLRDRLNSSIIGRWGYYRFKVVEARPMPSHKSHFVQMADVLAGAVSHHNNRHRITPGSKKGALKESLANHIASLVGAANFTSMVDKPHFAVWHFERKKKRPVTPAISGPLEGGSLVKREFSGNSGV